MLSQATDLSTQSSTPEQASRAESKPQGEHQGARIGTTGQERWVCQWRGVGYSLLPVQRSPQGWMFHTDTYDTKHMRTDSLGKWSLWFLKGWLIMKKLSQAENMVHISWITLLKKAMTHLFIPFLWLSLFSILPRVNGGSQTDSQTQRDKESLKKGTGHSRLVGGCLNKQRDLLTRFILGKRETSRCSHLPAIILSLYRGRHWVQSHI